MIPWHDFTFRALLAACCAEPAEDTPRLVLAERLDELSEREKCPNECCIPSPRTDGIYRVYDSAGPDSRWNKCPTCSGFGWVPVVCENWAELIRVQIRLAHPPWNSKDMLREFTLLPLVREAVLRGPACNNCEPPGRCVGELKSGLKYNIKCRKCHGTGFIGPLARLPADAVTWRRGMPYSATAPLSAWWIPPPVDAPTAWAVRVASETTCELCVAGDREPTDWTREIGGSNWGYTVRTQNQIPVPHDIPRKLFNALLGGEKNSDNWMIRYPTPDLARSALALAIRSEARAVWERDAHDILTGVTPQIES